MNNINLMLSKIKEFNKDKPFEQQFNKNITELLQKNINSKMVFEEEVEYEI